MLQEESLLPVTPPRNGWESEQNGEEFRRSQKFQISSDSSPEWGGVLGGVYEDSSPEYGGAMIMDSYHRYHGKLFLDPKSPPKSYSKYKVYTLYFQGFENNQMFKKNSSKK